MNFNQPEFLTALDTPNACVTGAPRAELLVRPENEFRNGTIMIVDDEPVNIKVVKKYMQGAGYVNFVTTSESREALGLIRREQPDVIVLDVMMPHVSGLHILEAIRSDIHLCHLPVLILTASADEDTRLHALDLGATDFLSKPVKAAELIPRVRNALVVKAHHDHMANYSARLEQEVRQRTADLAKSREEVIHVLARAAEYRDEETGNHVIRVGRYVGIIASQLGFDAERAKLTEQAAILHDVGKIGVPDDILLKPGELDEAEFETIRAHCEYGERILRGIPRKGKQALSIGGLADWATQSPILEIAAVIAMSHHEKWDGSGYPRGLAGEAIPIEGRITAVADVFDALSSTRRYKDAVPLDRCFELLEEGRAQHFDPQLLDAFLTRSEDVVRVTLELSDE